MSDKYAVIDAHRPTYSVQLMCDALAVAPSGYYAAQQRPPSARAVADDALRVHVRAHFRASGDTYGAPRVHAELKAQGQRVAKKRIARLMQEDTLVARPRRRFVVTTDSAHPEPVARNWLRRCFDVEALATLGGTNQVWASDITYIPTHQGFLYLAVVLDLASRRVIGWAMRPTLAEALVLDALDMALVGRAPMDDLLLHSDRGSQYASRAYQAVLAAQGITCSMSRKGNCWDNAVAESFFATLEHELLAKQSFVSHHAARRAIFEYIEVWYNRKRRHSSLGYVSPAEYEERLNAA
jgi:putative transposase